MGLTKLSSLVLVLAGAALAQRGGSTAAINSTPGFDPGAIDHSSSPCTNFYQYACGTWLKNNPIPADQASWGRFDELQEHNREILHQIAEKDAQPSPSRTPIEQKVGDYWAACMDESRINALGAEPLKAELARINAIQSKSDLAVELGRLHAMGVNALFNVGSGQDFKDSTAVIAQVDQGGLGLPERDYYFKEDDKSKEIRKEYVRHLAAMFKLLGSPTTEADTKAEAVMKYETALAKGSLDVTARRDPANVYHRMPVEQLGVLDPAFDWAAYWKEVKAPEIKELNVAVPEFLKAMDALLKAPDSDTKSYLVWHYVHNQAPLLPAAFVNENFRFYRTVLTGTKEMRPRWKRCIQMEDNELGEALGQEYVERTFGQEGKQRTLEMVHYLEQALGQDIQKLDWMSPRDPAEGASKNCTPSPIRSAIPRSGRIIPPSASARDDAIGNSLRASEFEFHRDLDKIGKPVDRLEWQMTPPTVNAYYDPQMNNINFPAGILQPPFFMREGDDAANFGAIGAVIGHELTHGFDDEGRAVRRQRQSAPTGGRPRTPRRSTSDRNASSINTAAIRWAT